MSPEGASYGVHERLEVDELLVVVALLPREVGFAQRHGRGAEHALDGLSVHDGGVYASDAGRRLPPLPLPLWGRPSRPTSPRPGRADEREMPTPFGTTQRSHRGRGSSSPPRPVPSWVGPPGGWVNDDRADERFGPNAVASPALTEHTDRAGQANECGWLTSRCPTPRSFS